MWDGCIRGTGAPHSPRFSVVSAEGGYRPVLKHGLAAETCTAYNLKKLVKEVAALRARYAVAVG